MTDSSPTPTAERILIIKLGALGDIILATSLIREIQAHHANAQIHLLTTPAFESLFDNWPNLDVTAIDRHGARSFLKMLGFMRSGFNRVYDLQSNDRSRLLCAASGIPDRVGNHPKYPWNIHPESPWHGQSHIYARMNEMLAAAGIAGAPEQSWLPVSDAQARRVRSWLEQRGLAAKSFVLFHAGASAARPEKRWPGFVQLGCALIDKGLDVVAVGAGPDAQSNRELETAGAINATNVFSIPELGELAASARFAVSNDSGPMHVMAIAQIPVYAFFGPSDWRRNHALGQAQRVFHKPDLASISIEEVLKRLHQDGVLDDSSVS